MAHFVPDVFRDMHDSPLPPQGHRTSICLPFPNFTFYVSYLCYLFNCLPCMADTIWRKVMRLNVVTNNADEVLEALNYAFRSNVYGVRAYLANRPAKGIVEFDIVSDEPTCISVENLREILPFLRDDEIRIRV